MIFIDPLRISKKSLLTSGMICEVIKVDQVGKVTGEVDAFHKVSCGRTPSAMSM